MGRRKIVVLTLFVYLAISSQESSSVLGSERMGEPHTSSMIGSVGSAEFLRTPDLIVDSVIDSRMPRVLLISQDPDNDGIDDSLDNCPGVYNPTQEDADFDGVGDSCDNCPNYWNPRVAFSWFTGQPDADEDGIGNVCDECTDQDGDGYGDPGFPSNTCPEDNCPGFANPDQIDGDGDGIGDPCEGLECGDYDGNGEIADIYDLILLVFYLSGGGPSPVSMNVANSGGCEGVDFHDLTCSWSMVTYFASLCDGMVDCPFVPLGSVSLDHVDGLYSVDTILTGQPIRFFIRFTGNDTTMFSGLANGFHVYSPSGAEWSGTRVLELADFGDPENPMRAFDMLRELRLFGMTGSGSDTIGLAYVEWLNMGLPPGFDSVTHSIEIGPIPHEYSGGVICLDSCWFPPGGSWLWAVEYQFGQMPYTPSWDGPHCFTIYNCCLIRGDINDDGSDPDIADLIYLVSYMFQLGPSLPCPTAADINGDESFEPDISDLIHLVMFMFQDGPAVVPCP